MNALEPLTLASRSPRRQALLRAAGLEIDVRAAAVDEETFRQGSPAEQALGAARAKARDVAGLAPPGRLVLAADTLVVLDGEVFNKPADPDDARRMLRRLAGRRHDVLTAICLGRAGVEPWRDEVVVAGVVFHSLDETLLESYVASGEPADKAGAYGIQGLGARLVADVQGDVTGVVGLPMRRLSALYREWTGRALVQASALRAVALAAFPDLARLPEPCLRGLDAGPNVGIDASCL
jgi:septum formation protein